MYVFELLYKIIYNIKHPKKTAAADLEDEYPNCAHIFVPVDSTKKILACTKCGIIKKLQ